MSDPTIVVRLFRDVPAEVTGKPVSYAHFEYPSGGGGTIIEESWERLLESVREHLAR